MKYFISYFLLLSIISCAPHEKRINYRKIDKAVSKKQIVDLHDGVLLVRLSTKKNTIAAMKKTGKIELADKTEAKQKNRNQNIITAFRTNFKFCPVYFFYSDFSKFVANNQLDSIVFLNDSLQFDTSIIVTNPTYFISELSTVEPDTRIYSKQYYHENGKEKVTNYGGSEITISALIIKSNQFEQLRKPFPYYVREFKGLPFHRAIYKTTLIMNNKLNNYYQKTIK